MADFLDYLSWRGDLSFTSVPLCETDAAIFAKLSYFPFDGIAGADLFLHEKKLSEIFAECEKTEVPSFVKDAKDLLLASAPTERFGNVRLSGYVNALDPEGLLQFSAVLFRTDGNHAVVAFRGTDDSITGWKEDFLLAFREHIPSHDCASAYLKKAFENPKARITVTGHSKGGHLGVYAAASLDPVFLDRLETVYNFDGPGFRPDFLGSSGYGSILGKIRNFIPESSVVGCLFEHRGETVTVASDKRGIDQHNLSSWQTLGPSFVRVPARSRDSIQIEKSIKAWTADMTPEETEEFVTSLFRLISLAEISNFQELAAKPLTGLKLFTTKAPGDKKMFQQGMKKLIYELSRTYFPMIVQPKGKTGKRAIGTDEKSPKKLSGPKALKDGSKNQTVRTQNA